MSNITISVPISVPITKKKDRSLNLNYYRNDHFQLLNNMKVTFDKIVTPLLADVPKLKYTKLRYTLFYGSKHKIDLSNICCIVDKFFQDTVVNNGILEDDNIDFINQCIYDWGGVDKDNPRMEVTFFDYKELEEPTVQIILTEDEIKSAINTYIFHQLTIKPNQKIDITFDTNESNDEVFSVINITNITDAGPVVGPVVLPKPTTLQYPTGVRGSDGQAAPTGQVLSNDHNEPLHPEEPALEPVSDELEEVPFEAGSATTQETDIQQPETPKPAGRSLFSNLTKPVNK